MRPPERTSSRQPLGWYFAWTGATAFAFFGVWHALAVGLGYDSHAYWVAVQDMDRLYGLPALSQNAYLYSPVFAQVVWPLGRLPWPVFWAVWSLLMAVAFFWLLRPLPTRWLVPAFIATVPEIVTGNIYAVMAVALVLGASSGPPWVFLGLTKITSGGLGLVWLTLTRKWRALVWGLTTAAGVLAVSVATAPSLWRDWLQFLLRGSQPVVNSISSPVVTFVLVGSGLGAAAVAALTRRAWLLPVAAILLSPTIGLNTLTLLAAIPRLTGGLTVPAVTDRVGRRQEVAEAGR
jgi:Glycosyltransferase family 87